MIGLLHAEVRKLRTIWSTYVLMAILVVVDLLFGFGLAFASRRGAAGLVPHGSPVWFTELFSVLDVSRLLALILGILIVTGEYRHKTVTPTLLAEPRRGRVIAAKLGASFGGGLVLGVLTMLAGLLLGFVLVGLQVHSCLELPTVAQGMSQSTCAAQHGTYFVATSSELWHEWWRIAPGIVLGSALFGIYGVGLGALLKNQVVAIVVALIFTLVVETIVGAIWSTIGEYLPGMAATALEDAGRTNIGGSVSQLLPWWGGALMLLIYGTALSIVGSLTTLRSDIT